MKIQGKHYRTIWVKEDDPTTIQTLDQRLLPFHFEIVDLKKPIDYEVAISDMIVRGAPLIGVAGAFGIYSATLSPIKGREREKYILEVAASLKKTRPTAIDLFHSVDKILRSIQEIRNPFNQAEKALELAKSMAEESIKGCKRIGENGLDIIRRVSRQKKNQPVNILTHCNAGWLACIDYGTATAPIYRAHDEGIPVHVWVDETRPRNQGSRLTAYELGEHGVPHTVIADNTGGHLMQHGLVDMVIVGTDRTSRNGDVANKIGTYLKALAAKDNNVPFYVALPSSSIDWSIHNGIKEIPIETRSDHEVKYIQGWNGTKLDDILLMPYTSKALNFGFDVTPGHLVTALITEKGICPASEEGLLELFPDQR